MIGTKNERLEAALRLARAGFLVVPGWPDRKHPRIKRWPEEATSDLSTIRAWWNRWPDSNPCYATGERARIFVLEIDRQHDGAQRLRGLEDQRELLTEPQRLRTRYLEVLENFLASVRRHCESCAFDYRLIYTDEPLGAMLSSLLASRKRHRRTSQRGGIR